MKRRRLRRLLLLALILSAHASWSVFGTGAPQWLQVASLGITALLACAWYRS